MTPTHFSLVDFMKSATHRRFCPLTLNTPFPSSVAKKKVQKGIR